MRDESGPNTEPQIENGPGARYGTTRAAVQAVVEESTFARWLAVRGFALRLGVPLAVTRGGAQPPQAQGTYVVDLRGHELLVLCMIVILLRRTGASGIGEELLVVRTVRFLWGRHEVGPSFALLRWPSEPFELPRQDGHKTTVTPAAKKALPICSAPGSLKRRWAGDGRPLVGRLGGAGGLGSGDRVGDCTRQGRVGVGADGLGAVGVGRGRERVRERAREG